MKTEEEKQNITKKEIDLGHGGMDIILVFFMVKIENGIFMKI